VMTKPNTLESRCKRFLQEERGWTIGDDDEFELSADCADFHRSETERLVREIREQADSEERLLGGTYRTLGRIEALRELAERIEKEIK
jgi:hypothetical protein